MNGTILIGTAGQGILRSVDDGASWHRLGLKEAIEFDGVVRSLAVDHRDPSRIFAGADAGICLSTDGGAHFSRLDCAANGMTVWALAIDPRDADVIYAGTGAPSRACMFRSIDGGNSWQQLPVALPEFCSGVHRPRILTITVDAYDGAVWFGVEEGGAWRSADRGDSWERIDQPATGIVNGDIHAIRVVPAGAQGARMHIVCTVNSVYTNLAGGEGNWHGSSSAERFDGMYYTRTIEVLPGPGQHMLLAIGDGTPGTQSRIYRSVDRGASWKRSLLHTAPNSTFWAFGVHPADPALVFAGTKYGQLFRSTDGGASWFKEWREFSEITAIAWTPFVATIVGHAQSRLDAVHEHHHD